MINFTISVSAGTGCYRHLQIPGTGTLYSLHKAILWSMDFKEDAPSEFQMPDRGTGLAADPQTVLQDLMLEKGDRFKYIYNPADPWVFQCKVLDITEDQSPKIGTKKCVGEPPIQYVDLDRDYNKNISPLTYPKMQISRLYKRAGFRKKDWEYIGGYLSDMLIFYGIIPVSEAFKILNEKIGISRGDFLEFIRINRHEAGSYYILNIEEAETSDIMHHYLIEKDIIDNRSESLYEILEGQKGKKWYVPSGDSVIRFIDPAYLADSRYTKPLYNFLRNKLHQDDEEARHVVSYALREIHYGARDEVQQIIDFMELFCRKKPRFTDTNIQQFIKICSELHNNTRMAENCGFTPNEIIKLYPPKETKSILLHQLDEIEAKPRGKAVPFQTKKVGRNDPCPCGSGKKYKNCCGRPGTKTK